MMASSQCNRVVGRQVRRSEEGAAMLIVMLILLMVTGTASFAIHATGFEMRASGYNRQAVQTRYVGETGARAAMAWVDHYGPPCAVVEAIRRTKGMSSYRALKMAPFEPELSPNKDAYRISERDFAGMSAPPMSSTALGPAGIHQSTRWISMITSCCRGPGRTAGYDVSTDRILNL